jgi:hypothetical protein
MSEITETLQNSTTPDSTTSDSTISETQPTESTEATPTQKTTFTDIEVVKYRSMSLNFINSNKLELIKIYITHLKEDGPGMLFISLIDNENVKRVDVSFVKEEVISLEILDKVNLRKEKNNTNIIYALLIAPCEDNIIELDIRDLAH